MLADMASRYSGLLAETDKPKIFGPLMLLGISVVHSNFLRSSTVRIYRCPISLDS